MPVSNEWLEQNGGNLPHSTQREIVDELLRLRHGLGINGYQIKRLLDFVDNEDESEVTLAYVDHERPDGNSNDGEMMPKGLYAWYTDYPEEGSMWLPETPEEHMESVTPPSGGSEHG